MPKDINNVSLLGNVASYELRYTPSGLAVLDLVIAGEETVTGNDGKPRQVAFYMRTSVVGKRAEDLSGDISEDGTTILHVAGELVHKTYKSQDGNEQQRLFIVAQNAQPVINAPQLGFNQDAGGNKRYKGGHCRATITARIVTDNAELRTTQNGDYFMGLRANVRGTPVNVDGQWQSPANWLKITLWRADAEEANNLGVTKGNEVYAEGRLQKGKDWTDRDGKKRPGDLEFSPTHLVWMKGTGSAGGTRAPISMPAFDEDTTSAFDDMDEAADF